MMSEDNGTYDISYNIFNYGYKELTQDAFICWLIKWAYYDETGYGKLKECGQDFIKALFKKHGKEVPQNLAPDRVKIWQQDNSIDVLARVGDYVLLIEDKTGTRDHSKQLERYYRIVSEGKSAAGKVDEGNIIPIYLKTGNQSLYEQMRIEKVKYQNSNPYKVFGRVDFLKLMKPFRTAHPIVDDFTDYLKHWEDDTQSYRDWQENGSGKKSYQSLAGFFRELENHLVVFDWDNDLVGFNNTQTDKDNLLENYRKRNWSKDNPWGWNWVPNQAGGFTGFWWYSKTVQSCGHDVVIYLQLEIQLKLDDENKPTERNKKLCFKVDTLGNESSSERRNIREDCYTRIEAEKNKLFRPHMGNGNTMTFAQWDDEKGQNPWLVFNKASVGPDIEETVNNLIRAQNILDRVASHA